MLNPELKQQWLDQAATIKIGPNLIYAAESAQAKDTDSQKFITTVFNDQAADILCILRSYWRDLTDKEKAGQELTSPEQTTKQELEQKLEFIKVTAKEYYSTTNYILMAQLIELWTLWYHQQKERSQRILMD